MSMKDTCVMCDVIPSEKMNVIFTVPQSEINSCYALPSHNWLKMHGFSIKTPRIVRWRPPYYSKRSRKKQARYREKCMFNPLVYNIENVRIRKMMDRYRCEPKKLRKKVRRIIIAESRGMKK